SLFFTPTAWCCGAGGGGYEWLRKELEGRFPGMLDVSGQGTPEVTGWFEVTVGGRLVHSKKVRGRRCTLKFIIFC
uniref:Selenoprotein W n=1 Tax=Anas platyrhynchos platyrhynchos TaxID=8840 RepID=A0A493TG60_ANAPP